MTVPLQNLIVELFDATPEKIRKAVREYGSLTVRIAMLGVAATKKDQSPLFFGYPPGIFISYKWDGEPMKKYVTALATHLRGRGYNAYLDVDELTVDADNYTAVPQFIASLQDCVYYLLLLTNKAADFIDARQGYTTWIFDESQHAIRLGHAGRLVIIPVLLEDGGTTTSFPREIVVDLTKNKYAYEKIDDLLPANPKALDEAGRQLLRRCVEDFDRLFLNEQFSEALAVLLNYPQLSETFDHRFRMMLYGIYTANQSIADGVIAKLSEMVLPKVLKHLYSGYCKRNNIPNRLVSS